jgi:hypothetical protein
MQDVFHQIWRFLEDPGTLTAITAITAIGTGAAKSAKAVAQKFSARPVSPTKKVAYINNLR